MSESKTIPSNLANKEYDAIRVSITGHQSSYRLIHVTATGFSILVPSHTDFLLGEKISGTIESKTFGFEMQFHASVQWLDPSKHPEKTVVALEFNGLSHLPDALIALELATS